jgi:hypothetical protein
MAHDDGAHPARAARYQRPQRLQRRLGRDLDIFLELLRGRQLLSYRVLGVGHVVWGGVDRAVLQMRLCAA